MPTIEAAARHIIAADLPVLFVDTCVLLDVIRSIKRREKDCAANAQELHLAATSASPRCVVAMSRLVKHEWGEHEQSVLAEAAKHLEELDDSASHFHDVCDVFGILPGFPRAAFSCHDVASKLHDLSRRILDSGIVIDDDDACTQRAFQRIMGGVPPSNRGGQMKDCAILEQCLAVARRLHAAGFQKKRAFCTSNSRDYCAGSDLHPALEAEFRSVGLGFCRNLGWGLHEVTH